MPIEYPERENFCRTLERSESAAFDFVVVAADALLTDKAGKLGPAGLEKLKACLNQCVRVLREGGLLFVQGRPGYLPELGVYLDQRLNFKYWIAIESTLQPERHGLPSVHAAMLLFAKGNGRFNVKRTRFPHRYCAACGRTLKDWGGKTHLMHPEGYVISDVWKDLPQLDNYTQISGPVLDTILQMLNFENEISGIVGPREGIDGAVPSKRLPEPSPRYESLAFSKPQDTSGSSKLGEGMVDVVHHGDAVEILRRYPDHSIDLVFADPPYNLDKAYHAYDDERAEKEYVKWCDAWLREYARVLKPSGSLYVLNLPRWTMYHAAFLNRHLYFQNWIVWDAMSEPRGKLMPAHYGLLFYTGHPSNFTFNYDRVGSLDARDYCLRRSCVRRRKAKGDDDKMPLTDIWWDIHRIKHRRDRDYHPCQLPKALMERIIRLSTNQGDVVLDALCGTGTTPVVAAKLGRRYVAIDVDKAYVQITQEKIAEVKRRGYIERESIHRPQARYSKKELQLVLRDLAAELGRLPTPQDVQRMTDYDPEVFFDTFPTWSKALQAARVGVGDF